LQANSNAIDGLVQALGRLPGVGVKSATRMAYHLLQHDPSGANQIAAALTHAVQVVRHCTRCHTFTEHELCSTCADPRRDSSKLCVVEMPADQSAVERTGAYKGQYFVLMGRLSPWDGVGPKEIGLKKLFDRLAEGEVQELILATNFTAEGEATAHAISEAVRPLVEHHGLKLSRLARGVPVGSELEHVDLGTIAHALVDRR
jgi:recombination protein RecR